MLKTMLPHKSTDRDDWEMWLRDREDRTNGTVEVPSDVVRDLVELRDELRGRLGEL